MCDSAASLRLAALPHGSPPSRSLVRSLAGPQAARVADGRPDRRRSPRRLNAVRLVPYNRRNGHHPLGWRRTSSASGIWACVRERRLYVEMRRSYAVRTFASAVAISAELSPASAADCWMRMPFKSERHTHSRSPSHSSTN